MGFIIKCSGGNGGTKFPYESILVSGPVNLFNKLQITEFRVEFGYNAIESRLEMRSEGAFRSGGLSESYGNGFTCTFLSPEHFQRFGHVRRR